MNTPPKILVVDDSAVILKAFEAKLTAAGLSVIISREALAAVGLARVEKPDLIILDINFPPETGFSSLQWDGLSVLQWFKRYEDVAAIPILVMSSDAPEACEKKVLAGGAAAFSAQAGGLRPTPRRNPAGSRGEISPASPAPTTLLSASCNCCTENGFPTTQSTFASRDLSPLMDSAYAVSRMIGCEHRALADFPRQIQPIHGVQLQVRDHELRIYRARIVSRRFPHPRRRPPDGL